MSEDEKFIDRWSRRKREAAQDAGKSQPKADGDPLSATTPESTAQAETMPEVREPAFDPSTLPSLESITANSDIRSFLQPGVPLDLSRAALRRAWVADPAIRDFVGLAENAWDFTAPDAMHGFGALDPAQVPQLLAQIFGGGLPKTQPETAPTAAPANQAVSLEGPSDVDSPDKTAVAGCGTTEEPAVAVETGQAESEALLQRSEIEKGDANASTETDMASVHPRRHGGALPG